MICKTTPIAGLLVLEPRVFLDTRGYFFESFNEKKFYEAGLPTHFVQDNQSQSQQGTLRGLHFQKEPHGQGKLVRVVAGEIYDVAVDIRPDSQTFGQYFGLFLDAVAHHMLYIPPGFAHGFYVTKPDTVVSYKCTTPYQPAAETGIRWDDADLAISWPLLPGMPVVVSEKDQKWSGLKEIYG